MEKQEPAPTPQMAEEVILTFADHLGSELVDIVAGKEEKCFTVHKGPLVSKCDYLRKLVIPEANGKRSYIDFKAEDTGAVSLLVNFLYKGSIPTSKEYVLEIKEREYAKSNAQLQNPTSSMPTVKFSTSYTSRPLFGHAKSENNLSPFGKLSSQPGSTPAMTQQSSPVTFGVPQTLPGRAPWNFGSPTPTRTLEPKSQHYDATVELYQTTLLRLCILAERISWPAIFNAAIRSYSRGEGTLDRSSSIAHARLIYGKSAANSTLRDMILDGMYNLGEDGLEKCMAFASEDKNFFRALCTRSLRPKQEFDSVVEALNSGAYDLVEKGPAVIGAPLQLEGTLTPLKSTSSLDASSRSESSADTKMEE